MGEQESYSNVAKLLRQRAVLPGVPAEQIINAIKLAEYFETLAINPWSEIADRRFG